MLKIVNNNYNFHLIDLNIRGMDFKKKVKSCNRYNFVFVSTKRKFKSTILVAL